MNPTAPYLRTFGKVEFVPAPGQPGVSPEAGKTLAVLAYLAASPRRTATRERLIDLFWADLPTERGRASLRQAIYKLNTLLVRNPDDAAGAVTLRSDIWCDRDAFLTAIEQNDLITATRLYQGPFGPRLLFPGAIEFELWLEVERRRLHELFASAAEQLGTAALDRHDTQTPAAFARVLLDHDALDERGWRLRLAAEAAGSSRMLIAATVDEMTRLFALERREMSARMRDVVRQYLTRIDAGTPATGDLAPDLVGRQTEFAALVHAWRSVKRGRGAHVQLTAAAGVGKTRLLDDLAVRIETDQPRSVARAAAIPSQRTLASASLATLVCELCKLPGIKGLGDEVAAILVDLQPAVAECFPHASTVRVAPVSTDERDRKRVDACVALIAEAAHQHPIAILIDDLHWWDATSCPLLGAIVERLTALPVLVVTAGRPGVGELAADHTSTLTLAPLDPAQVEQLVTSLAQCHDADTLQALARELHASSDGVPLLVLQGLRDAVDQGALTLTDGTWHVADVGAAIATLRTAMLTRRTALHEAEAEAQRVAAEAWGPPPERIGPWKVAFAIAAVLAGSAFMLGQFVADFDRAEAELHIMVPGDTPTVLRTLVRGERWHLGTRFDTKAMVPDTLLAALLRSAVDAPAFAPDGSVWVGSIPTTVNGPTELALGRDGLRHGAVSRAPGDDVGASWAPDGGALAFATTRWSADGDFQFDIATRTRNDSVTRLTHGADNQTSPAWSPDGLRIAFIYRAMGPRPDAVCWTTPDARVERCQPSATGVIPLMVLGWADASTVITSERNGAAHEVVQRDVDRDTRVVMISSPAEIVATVSQDGHWIAWTTSEPGKAGVVRVAHTANMLAVRSHRVEKVGADKRLRLYWRRSARPRYVGQVKITPPSDSLVVGESYQLSSDSRDSYNSPIAVPAAVQHWRVADTSVATVSATGMLMPRAQGSTTVHLSAGGWRRDSIRVTIGSRQGATLHAEQFGGGWRARWDVIEEEPRPQVAMVNGIAEFRPNGDQTYPSGAYSRATFDASHGLALDAWVSTPVTRGKWQRLTVALVSADRSAPSIACECVYPESEGWSARGSMAAPRRVAVDSMLASGAWYQVRVQVFADQTCGIAVNGKPLGRVPMRFPAKLPFRIALLGQSVGTTIAVRDIRVSSGVPAGVDWSALEAAVP